mmetsp:Transcript_31780/g.72650  ORF Transcript_31780/g.72650 Transcript_31780/m.72650 type:complete len:456 (+) Transcript_31780:84-1451(+)
MASSRSAGHRANRQKSRGRGGPGMLLWIFAAVVCLLTLALSDFIIKVQLDDHQNGVRNTAEQMLRDFASGGSRSDRTLKGRGNSSNTDESQIVLSVSSGENDPTTSVVEALIDRRRRVEVPDSERSIAFVHVGKSGGSTISLLLRNGCMTAVEGTPCEPERYKKIQEAESTVSKRVDFYIHTPHVESGKMAEYYGRVTSVVVVARDPLDRFVSAFLSRHPKNIDATRMQNSKVRREYEARGKEPPAWAKNVWGNGDVEKDQYFRAAFEGCYPNLQELTNCAGGESIRTEVYNTTISWRLFRTKHSKQISLPCRSICREIEDGTSEYIHHVKYNYEAFLADLPSRTEVFVIRTKNLWPDWININNLLGAQEDVEIPNDESGGQHVNSRGGRQPVRNNLDAKGQKYLCEHLLKKDIIRYIDLMNRAVNLSDEDVKREVEGINASCPTVLESLAKQRK